MSKSQTTALLMNELDIMRFRQNEVNFEASRSSKHLKMFIKYVLK